MQQDSEPGFTDEFRRLIARGCEHAETPSGLRLLETLSASMLVMDASRLWTLLGLDVLIFGDREQAHERLKLWSEVLSDLAQSDLVESLEEVGRLTDAILVTPAWIRMRLRKGSPDASPPGAPRCAVAPHDSVLLLILGLLVETGAVDRETAAAPGDYAEDEREPLLT